MRFLSIFLTVALIAAYMPAGAQSEWVTLVSPGDGETLAGRRAEVSVSYSTPDDNKATRIVIEIDGTRYGIKHLEIPSGRGIASFLVDSNSVGNGSHTIIAKVYSGSKLVGSASGSCRVSNSPIDVLPPDVKVDNLKDGDVVSGVTEIRIASKDNSGQDPLVSIFVDKSLKTLTNNHPYSYSWDTKTCDDGKHVIAAYASDAAGNRNEAKTVEVMVNNSGAPAVTAARETESITTVPRVPPAKTAPVVAAKEPVVPIIPMERSRDSAVAARSVERQPSIPSAGNTAVTKPDRPIAVTRRAEVVAPKMAEKPVRIAAVEKPTVRKESAASAKPPATSPKATTRTSSSVIELEPLVLAQAPAAAFETGPRTQTPSVTERVARVAPTMTAPKAQDVTVIRTDIIAALPPDLASPSEPAIPYASAPLTTRTEAPSYDERPEVRSDDRSSAVAPRLARPNLPKPVRIALAPKPEPVTAPPAVEPRKIVRKLTTTTLRRTVVTELRYAIAAVGGGIISWDQKTRTVLAEFNGAKISLVVDNPVAVVNGKRFRLATAPRVNSRGRTLVDVRFLKSIIGARLQMGSGQIALLSK